MHAQELYHAPSSISINQLVGAWGVCACFSLVCVFFFWRPQIMFSKSLNQQELNKGSLALRLIRKFIKASCSDILDRVRCIVFDSSRYKVVSAKYYVRNMSKCVASKNSKKIYVFLHQNSKKCCYCLPEKTQNLELSELVPVKAHMSR